MSRRRQLNLWTLIFLVASIAVIFLVSCGLRSGYAGLGDGQLFVFRDGLLLFSLIIIGLFVATFVYCIYSFQLPVFDYLSRIVFVNVASYSAIGLLMYLFRIPLYSGSLLLTAHIFLLSQPTVSCPYWFSTRNPTSCTNY